MRPILVLTYWSFNDGLIQSAVLPYARMIARISRSKVYIMCLEKANIAVSKQQQQQINYGFRKENIEIIFFTYHPFGVKQALLWVRYLCKLLYLIIKQRVKYIHAICTPAGAIGYLLAILTGRKLIIDSYEPHAEAMVENGGWSKTSVAFKILFYLEKKQTKKAVFLIAAASKMENYAQHAYKVDNIAPKMFLRPMCVDRQLFDLSEKHPQLTQQLNFSGKVICVYAGKIGGIYLDDEVFDFFKQCHIYWGDKFNILMLGNTPVTTIEQQLNRVQLPHTILTQLFVPHNEVPKYLSIASFAFTPVKPVPTKRYCNPIKDGEYWAMGLPVVITANISDDSDIIEANNAGAVLKELTTIEYIQAVKKIDVLLQGDNDELKGRIKALADKYRTFDIAETVYKKIYSKADI
ncbi:hypothetical protein ACFGVR_13500 [Mucilaginibacter sp. AW1-3]